MARSVLLVEDEQSIGRLVRAYLEREGFDVAWVESGEEGLAELARSQWSIVVLDVALPGVDGFEVCRRIRTVSSLPVLMLTARDDEADRVGGLEVGADDYVTKPFSPRELVARVHAILRRTERAAGPGRTLRLSDVVLREAAREVDVAGEPVTLTSREFDLLGCLMENEGVVLSREQLLDRVWGGGFPGGTRTVDVHVAQLRRKLGRPGLIRTVRGAGYKAIDT
jgi:DNA-binding response OmpR family regulator